MTKLTPMPLGQLPPGQLPLKGPTAASRLSQSVDPQKVAKAANDFEAMAIGQLLQPMFDSVDTANNALGGGAGEEAWKPMLVQAFATQIVSRGGLGLAKPVYDAMLQMQGNYPK